MGGVHRQPQRRAWPIVLLSASMLVGGWEFGHVEVSRVPVLSPQVAAAQAQAFAVDVMKQCNTAPQTFSAATCSDAVAVANTPVHDGKDGADGKNGIDGLNGRDGTDGRNGRDGSDAREDVFTFPGGTVYGCPRSGGTDVEPIYRCQVGRVVKTPTESAPMGK